MIILFTLLIFIGILLAVILLLAILILFHPIFYQVKGNIQDSIGLQGHLWWLFQILRLEFEIKDGDIKLRFRIYGFARQLSKQDTIPKETSPVREEIRLTPKKTEKKSRQKRRNAKKNNWTSSAKNKNKKKQNKNSVFSGWKRFQAECSDEKNQQAVSHILREVWYLLLHLKPNYVQSELSFSAGDPALTGQVTGILSLLPILYRYDAHVYPDFESEKIYVRGSFSLKGHLALYHVVIVALRTFTDVNIKRLIKKVRK